MNLPAYSEDIDEFPPDYEVDDPFPRNSPPDGEPETPEEFDEFSDEFAKGFAEEIEGPQLMRSQDTQTNLGSRSLENRNLENFLSELQISESSSDFFQTEIRFLYGIQNSSPNQSGCKECLKMFRFRNDILTRYACEFAIRHCSIYLENRNQSDVYWPLDHKGEPLLPDSKLLDHCKERKVICIADGPIFWPKAGEQEGQGEGQKDKVESGTRQNDGVNKATSGPVHESGNQLQATQDQWAVD